MKDWSTGKRGGYVTWSYKTPVSAAIDGHNGMGQFISVFAMKKVIEKAKGRGRLCQCP